MMDDLVQRLRYMADDEAPIDMTASETARQAADEIERLRERADAGAESWNALQRTLAEVERLRAQLAERDRDAERWRYAEKHSAWHRQDDRNGRYAALVVKLPYEADLSCKAMREAAIDAAMATPKD